MAFCTRSERIIKLSNYENFPNNSGVFPTKNNNNEKNLNKSKTNLIINYSKKRFSRANNNNKLEFKTPASGFYNLNNSSANIINKHSYYSFDNTHLSNNSTKEVSIGNYNNKIGFLSKEERFKNLSNNINNNNYNNISNNSNLESKINNNNNIKNIKNEILNLKYNNNNNIENLKKKNYNKKYYEIINKNKTNLLTGSLNRLLSIPSKKMNGYLIKNKSAEIILNPLFLEKKENEIGPGSYDIKMIEKNNIIDWNKQINLKEKIKKIKEKNEKDFIEKMKKFGDKKENKNNNNKINSVYENYIKIKNKKENYLKLLKINENEKKALINNKINLLNNEIPGPGYYEKDINRTQIIINKNKIQNFGNSLKRNLFEENKNSNNFLGPTTYFNQKNKFEKDKKINYFYFINKSLERSVLSCKKTKNNFNENININKNLIPGPGSYNLSKSFIKKSASEKELLHSYEKRNNIFNNIKNNNPGPGAYLSQNYLSEFNYNKNNKIIEKFYEEDDENYLKKESNKINEENEKRRNEIIEKINEKKNISPSPNDYLVDFYNSIEYFNLVKSRNKNIQKINGPFLISSLRFKNENNNNNNLKEKNFNYNDFILIKNINKNNKNKHNIFNKFNNSFLNLKHSSSFCSKINRFDTNKEENNKLGPGYYEKENQFDWNKKTFNILFINQNNNIYK